MLAAACLHAGFQLTVTALVYPALSRVGPAEWDEAHRRHSRAVTPLVGIVYATVVAAGAWSVAAGPLHPGTVVALVGSLAALAVTGLVAAPLHGRLGREGPVPHLLDRLRRADLLRSTAAVIAVAGAAAACLRG
jgi:hypothetical protein